MNKKLLTMGLAALLMAGCSSDDVVGENNDGDASAVKGYVGITIALPSTSASRAVVYDEGTPEEYAVNDVTLLFFNGDDELKQVTQFKAGDFTWTPAEGSPDGITTETVLPVVPLKYKDATNVLAIVNNNNDLLQVTSSTFDGNGLIADAGSLKDESDVSIMNKTTLLQAIENTNVTAFTSNGYFMSSAAISNLTDGDRLFTVVTPKESKQKAMDNAKNTVIYVERIVGKATVNHATGGNWTDWTYEIDDAASVFNDDKIEFQTWALDLTNTKTYPFHKVSAEAGKNNGFDEWTVGDFTGNQNRYMWAIDPNYSADGAADLAVTSVENVNNALNKPLYCLENTFNLPFMKQPQTTRLLLKAKYTPNSCIGTGSRGTLDNTGWFRLGEGTQAYTLQGIEAELLKMAKVIDPQATGVTVSNLKVGKNAFAETGDINTIVVNTGSGTSWSTPEYTKLINMAGKLTYFENSMCYYPVLIKHFAQPWINEDYLNYPNHNNNDFLGRYGIVRNNWYEITINSVSAPGEPVYPTVPDLADDVTNYYIQATVKILDWAKRSQSVDL